jgi:H+/Cl- antiporter ClcA
MGIGGGVFLIAIGAVFAWAVHANTPWLDLRVVGWVLMFAGLAVILLTLYFWNDRRRQNKYTLVEQARYVHDPEGSVQPDPPPDGPPPGTP